jgi:hypothetical protein
MISKIKIDKACKCIRDFLMENGGYSNGYVTIASGTVENYGRIDWGTPTSDKLTGVEIKRLGCELNNRLVKIFGSESLSKYKIQITNKSSDCYGGFKTEIQISTTHPVCLF